MVETGFTRAKNAVNIMMKNLMDFTTIHHGTMGISGGPGSMKFKSAPVFESKDLVNQV